MNASITYRFNPLCDVPSEYFVEDGVFVEVLAARGDSFWDPSSQGVKVDVGVGTREIVPTHHLHKGK